MELKFNSRSLPIILQIAEHLPGGFFIYTADDKEELLFFNHTMVEYFECDDDDDFKKFVKNSFRGIVFEDDYEAVTQNICTQIISENKGFDKVTYRIRTKNGRIRWLRDYGRFAHTKEYGDVFYVFVNDVTETVNYERDITEQKDNALRTTQLLYQTMQAVHSAMHSAEWYYDYDMAGNLQSVYCSDDVWRMLGYKNTTEIPHGSIDILRELVHPDDRAAVAEAYKSFIEDTSNQKAFDQEYRIRNKNGRYLWYRAVGSAIRREDGTPIRFTGLFMNVDKQKAMEQRIAKQQRDLKKALNKANEARDATTHIQRALNSAQFYMEFDENNSIKFIDWSDELLSILGYQRGAAELHTYRGWFRLIHPDDISLVKKASDEVFSEGKNFDVEYRIKTLSKGYRYFRVATHIIRDDMGNPKFLHGVFMDIHERKLNELALQDALQMAQHANQSKTIFLSNMSHDIRTPMNAIIGFNTLARQNIDNHAKLEEYLGKIESSSKFLLSLINDVLDMSRIESGKVHLNEASMSIKDLVTDIRRMVGGEAQKNGLDMVVDVSGIKDDVVLADKLRLSQIFMNLLNNAVKFTPEGGKIFFTVTQKDSSNYGYGDYEFVVRDTGMGMTREFIKKIFEPFERERSATVSGIQGSGLGMAITKNLVDMMEGRIDINSHIGVGSEFIVSLRFMVYSISDETPIMGTASVENESSEQSDFKEYDFSGKTALLVEDNMINQEIAKTLLENVNFTVHIANNGREALTYMLGEDAQDLDVILMDIQMPIMNGYVATKAIRGLGYKKSQMIPIIAMTANAFDEDKKNAFQAGMNDHISKPIDIDELYRVLDEQIFGREP